MSYTALYRKFRPQDFEDVKGQDHIVTALKNHTSFLKTKKMPVNFVKEKSYPPIARSSWPGQELIWKDTKCSLIRSTHESISCILDEL